MRRFGIAALALTVAAAAAPAQQRTSDRDFSWDGRVTSGRWLYVRNLNGSIRVERATGDRAEVTAVKRWRRGNPEDIRIETRRLEIGRASCRERVESSVVAGPLKE